jgi:hypothetical protein
MISIEKCFLKDGRATLILASCGISAVGKFNTINANTVKHFGSLCRLVFLLALAFSTGMLSLCLMRFLLIMSVKSDCGV